MIVAGSLDRVAGPSAGIASALGDQPWRRGPRRARRRGSNHTPLPSSSISAPQATEHIATMARPRPKVASRSSCSSPRGRGGTGGCARPVGTSTRGCSRGATDPHGDGGLGVQERVGDELGDPELGALHEVVAAELGRRRTTHRRASETERGSGVRVRAGRSAACVAPGGRGNASPLADVPAEDQSNTSRQPVFRRRTFRGQTHARTRRNRVVRLSPDPAVPADGVTDETSPRLGVRARENERSGATSPAGSTAEEKAAWLSSASAQTRHRVVVIGSGFGGLFGTKALQARRRRRHHDREDDPPPLPAAALPGGHRHPLRGRDRPADPRDPRRPEQRPGAARRGHRHRPRRPHGHLRTCSAARP